MRSHSISLGIESEISGLMTVLATGVLLLVFVTMSRADIWDDRFYAIGIDGEAKTAVMMGDDLIVAGNFTSAGPLVVNNIARWDGASWHPLGSGFDDTVYDLVLWGDDLIACGAFTKADGLVVNHVASWDGIQWQALGAGLPATEYALAVYEDQLWCGGWRFNGSVWSDVLQVDDFILDLILHQGQLVAGGHFLNAGEEPAAYVLAWDGMQIIPLPGQPREVVDLEVVADELYALADYVFGEADPVTRWDGMGWPVVGDLPEDYVSWYQQLVNDGGQLRLLKIVNLLLPPWWWTDIGTWTGSSWEWLPETFDMASGKSLFPYGDDLVLSGSFSHLGETVAHRIARLTATGSQAMGSGGLGVGDGWALGDICSTTEGVAVGGNFQVVGSLVSGAAAIWDGVDWQPRDAGDLNIVELVWHANQLHAFFWAGDVVAINHMYWAGGQWEFTNGDLLGSGLPDDAISYEGLLLTVNGDIHDWTDPWNPVLFADLTGGSGNCFTEWNGKLVVGGFFDAVAGVPAARIAIHDAGVWSDAAGGTNGPVKALADHEGSLIAAGAFSLAGGVSVKNIASFDGVDWQPLGGGLLEEVLALASYRGFLYAGGSFATVGRSESGYLARWDGHTWELVGDGLDGPVTELVVHAGKLHLAGEFGVTGNLPSVHFAVWDGSTISAVPPPLSGAMRLFQPAPNPFNPTTSVRFELVQDAHVQLTIYDVRGHRIATLVDAPRAAGAHTVTWNARDDAGRRVAAGNYFLRLQASGQVRTTKMMLVE